MNESFPADLARKAHALFRRGFNEEEISLELRQKGAAENLLQDLINHVKQIRSSKRRKNGFLCCAVGIFLLVFGCMLTFFLYNNGGGILCVFFGLTTLGDVFSIIGVIDLWGGEIYTYFINKGGVIRFVMYGLTTLGVGFTIKGMIDLLGW